MPFLEQTCVHSQIYWLFYKTENELFPTASLVHMYTAFECLKFTTCQNTVGILGSMILLTYPRFHSGFVVRLIFYLENILSFIKIINLIALSKHDRL